MNRTTTYGTPPIVKRRFKNYKKSYVYNIKRVLKKLIYLAVWVFAIALFVSLVVLISMCLDDPHYAVKEVRIEGLQHFQESDLIQSKNNVLGKNLLQLTVEEVKQEFMKNPFIKECKVEKIHPNIVKVRVEEISPYATLFVDDNLFLISHTGKVLKQIHNIKEAYGPLISGIKQGTQVKTGKYLDDEGLWSAMEFWYEYNQVPRERGVTISEIIIDSGGNLKVFFNEVPCETRWKRENLKRQVQNFSIALNKVDLTTRFPCSEYIDLRFNDDIIYK